MNLYKVGVMKESERGEIVSEISAFIFKTLCEFHLGFPFFMNTSILFLHCCWGVCDPRPLCSFIISLYRLNNKFFPIFSIASIGVVTVL